MLQKAHVSGLILALGLGLIYLPTLANAQSIDQHFDPIVTVPDTATYPEAVQQLIEEGYRQLSEATGSDDDLHLDAAKAAFDDALEIDPRAVHALNGVGIYELTKDEQWLVILESLKKLFNRDHISMAIKAFEKSLEVDSDFHAARYNLALAHRQARGIKNYERAIQQLERLVEEAPGFGDAFLLLVVTYRDAGDLTSMVEKIQNAPEETSPSPASHNLLLGYALVNLKQPVEGAAAYRAGIGAIEDPWEADLYWHDIRPIASPNTEAEFQRLDMAGKRAYLLTFWQRLADQSFTSFDERVAEHYRRLHHAYENYRLDLPERRHYSAAAAYVPPWQTGFDDRGAIYLRHGEPDDTATHAGPDYEKNISWRYDRAGGDPLVFHFVSDEDIQDFKLVRRLSDVVITDSSKLSGQQRFSRSCGVGGGCDSYDTRILATEREAMRELYSSRGHLDPYYDRAATSLDEQILEREESNLARDIAIATHSVSYTPDLPESPLLYPVHPVVFKSVSGRGEVFFYYALPTADVSVLPYGGGGSEIDYRYQLLVSALGDRTPLARQEDDVKIASAKPIPRESGVMLPGARSVVVGPGDYEYGMKLTDLNSGRFNVRRGAVHVDDFGKPGLAVSGIVLANRISPASDPSNPFVRWGKLKVLPLPSRMYRRTQPVFVYYEVYGLSEDATGAGNYRTTYTLESRQPDRNIIARFFSSVGELLTGGEEKGSITYSFERSQPSVVDPLLEFFSLDVSESPPGDYMLTVDIEDLETNSSLRRQVELSLVD
jgi:GWxTD domain-containing protein